MKIKKLKSKKGMTLIEVIISVALLVILLIPMSNLLLAGFKNSKISKAKQNATYVGQKILEEIQYYDEIILKQEDNGKQYFQLLDGYKIYKAENENKFEGDFEADIYELGDINREKNEYRVKVTLVEDKEFRYEDTDNLEKNKDAAFILKISENANKKGITFLDYNNEQSKELSYDNKAQAKEIPNNILIKLEENNLKVIDKEEDNEIIEYQNSVKQNNKIVLFFDSSYNGDLNIEVENNLKDVGEVYIIKANEVKDYNILTTKGDFVIFGPINKLEKNTLGNKFNYYVEVKNKIDKILFEGYSSKNIRIVEK